MEDKNFMDYEVDTDSERDIEVPPLERDSNGRVICPGHPELCLWSGAFPGFDSLCVECNYRTQCSSETTQQ